MVKRRDVAGQGGSGGNSTVMSGSSDGGSSVPKRQQRSPQSMRKSVPDADFDSDSAAASPVVRAKGAGSARSAAVKAVVEGGAVGGSDSPFGGNAPAVSSKVDKGKAPPPVGGNVPSSSDGGRGVGRQGPYVGLGDVSVATSRAQNITRRLVSEIVETDLSTEVVKRVIGYSAEYEALIISLLGQNERLRGRLDTMTRGGSVVPVRPAVATTVAIPAAPAPVAAAAGPVRAVDCSPVVKSVAKPVETWSLVVQGLAGQSAEDVASKVIDEVAPTLKERVHEIRPLRGGGVVIRTPSCAERALIAKNVKFAEAGLSVTVPDGNDSRVVVQGVDLKITHDEFMGELFEKNLKDNMTLEEFKAGVRVIGRPWDGAKSGTKSIVVEGKTSALQPLLTMGRCYVKWYSFRVRSYDLVSSCYRCLSFDHLIKDCRYKERTCSPCGQQGHFARDCINAVSCRNCAFEGRASAHRMMSEDCPLYRVMLDRVRSKH